MWAGLRIGPGSPVESPPSSCPASTGRGRRAHACRLRQRHDVQRDRTGRGRRCRHHHYRGPTPATPVAGTATGDLRSACQAAEDAIEGTIQQLFDHPNDLVFAAKVYADGAVKLRKLGAGTPIEAQINNVAATFESFASELQRGEDDGDTSRLPKAGAPLQKACS